MRQAAPGVARPGAGPGALGRGVGVTEISAYAGQNMRVITPSIQGRTENFNLVVSVETNPDRIEVVMQCGCQTLASDANH